MRWLLFLSRIAFISNLFFLVAFSFRLTNWMQNEDVVSTIVIIGYVLVAIFNPLVNLMYIIFLIGGRKKLNQIPKWLIVANVLFLIMQICYILYLNDPRHS